nr:MAG TPA: hypothetical protein [Caudoviricetes sp.]
MTITTQTLTNASSLIKQTLLVDTVDLYTLGETQTEGYRAYRKATLVEPDVAALVQTTVLANAVESQVDNTYSVKVPLSTEVEPGMVARVIRCQREPSLVGKHLMVDKVSQNGLAMLRKCVATDFHQVDQQGKGEVVWP